jgi:hypothetical protein
VHASRLPSIDLRRFADQISNRHLSALSSMSLLFGNLLLNVSHLVTLDPNSSFNFQARLATVGASFDTYGKRKKCPEALLNFYCSHMLLYKAINLRIFKEPSAFESPISSGMRTM